MLCFLLYRETGNFMDLPMFVASPPHLWPRIMLGLLAVLSAMLVAVNAKELLKEKKEKKPEGAPQGVREKIDLKAFFAANKKVVAAMVATLAFLFLFIPLGFAITCFVYFVVITMILEPTRDKKVIIFRVAQSLALIILIFLVFTKGLSVQLPSGPFPAHWFM